MYVQAIKACQASHHDFSIATDFCAESVKSQAIRDYFLNRAKPLAACCQPVPDDGTIFRWKVHAHSLNIWQAAGLARTHHKVWCIHES
jgi:hypothetical protein